MGQKPHDQYTSAHKHHDAFGAPHFPPSENLPPQAKRLAEAKRKRAAESPQPAPSATPVERAGDLRSPWMQTRDEVLGHVHAAREAAAKLWRESLQILNAPRALFMAFIDPRRAA